MDMDTDTAIKEFEKYIHSDYSTWTQTDEGDNFKIYRREVDPPSTLCVRFEAVVEGVSPDNAFIAVEDIRCRKYWDHRMEHYEVIEETDDYIVQYNKLMKVNVPFFSQRD